MRLVSVMNRSQSVPGHAAYRPDIDGMRAIAVLAVVANHALPALATSGFVGVDVFFVLSGFLLTGIIHDEVVRGAFSYSSFYWRRCRRIIPALVVTLALTWMLGALLLTGSEFASLGWHIEAAGIFASNIALWREVGYFDTAANAKPLLHLWSLGIEEQFYLLWPTLAVVLIKLPKYRVTALALISLCSLALCWWAGAAHPSAAFYLLPARFWELSCGGLLAFAMARGTLARGTVAPGTAAVDESARATWRDTTVARLLPNVVSGVGASLLLASFVLIDDRRIYPGVWAVLPVAATVALLAAGPHAWFNRVVLGSTVAVWFGIISYPLYLLHWPLLSFFSVIRSDLGVPQTDRDIYAVGLALLAVVLAFVTYRYIELPTQRWAKSLGETPWRSFNFGRYLGPLGGLAAIGAFTSSMHGFPLRYRDTSRVDVDAMLSRSSRYTMRTAERTSVPCQLPPSSAPLDWCFRSEALPARVAIFGDSHAEVVYPGLASELAGTSVMMIGQQGCPPILDVAVIRKGDARPNCVASNALAVSLLTTTPSIETVLLVARGPLYLAGKGFGEDETHIDWSLQPASAAGAAAVNRTQLFERGLSRTVDTLLAAGKQVMVVLDVPELGFHASHCVVGRPLGLRTLRTPCAIDRRSFDARNTDYRNMVIRVLRRYPAVRFFDASQLFCDTRQCIAKSNDTLLYSDDDHLSLAGSLRVSASLAPVVRAMLTR